MKKNIIAVTALLVLFTALSAFKTSRPAVEASLSFKYMVYDFGDITKGVPVSHSFEFTNPSSEAISITRVSASCGCTVTEYTRGTIPTGGEGLVKATYNAATPGLFSKTVSVFHSGSETPIVLTIKGNVKL